MKYGKLINGEIQYAPVRHGALVTDNGLVFAPSVEVYNANGYYKVVNVEEDGTDEIKGNVLYHYIAPAVETSKSYEERVVELIRGRFTADDELAIHRHYIQDQTAYADEWTDYNTFVEQCKATAKEELGL